MAFRYAPLIRWVDPIPEEWMMTQLPQRIPRTDRYTDWNVFFQIPVCRWREMGIIDDKGRFLTPVERDQWLRDGGSRRATPS